MIERFLFQDYINDKITLEQIYHEYKIDSESFLKALASDENISYSTLEELDLSLGEKFPCSFLLKFKILPILSKENTLYIASSKPCSLELLDEIRIFYEAKDIEVLIANEFKIMKFLYKLQVKEKLQNLSANLRLEWKENKYQNEQSYISQIFDFILDEILEFNPSDIHIEARENDALIRFRVDGILREFACLEKDIYEALVFHIKFLSQLNVAESRKAQDGNFELKIKENRYDFRISSLPLQNGESIVIRILKHNKEILDLENLNLGEKNLTILKKALYNPYGMILLTGPTGSGKSTSLYACLNELKSIEKKIISVEDPIEYKMPLVQQILLNPKAGLEFNNALRAILRQDPDIIMIGEIRDEESLDIAIKASLTGHLLLSTLHTNNAISTIDRLIDMNVKPYLIASALRIIIAQRLVRKLCPKCKQKSTKIYEIKGDFFEAKGCEHCHHSGYQGRELISECLYIDEEIAQVIREGGYKNKILELAKAKGFQSMFEQGLQKVKEGITSIDELIRVLNEAL
ncbi:type II/IV secretion system protein [Campylobacter coli]|nr:type II/IV secretion system protein [Campylobacter coli]EAJ7402746.1 type II/IV secretion system protein [Campylobacter coli]EED2626412.1 type II/IV secretion system protein [Campylobacter coli]EGK8155016.1 type II/IV secretion system protein [Campylobacter coli]HEA7232565.1 type II/IV secretion system protein [Campylobacter coli]